MKIKVDDKILDYEGKEVLKDDKTAFTVRDAISIALNGQLRD